MSIVAVLRSISPVQLQTALADPSVIEDLLSYDELDGYPERWCHLEKTQDAIHFLLTGDRQPSDSVLSAAIYGREETGFMLPAGAVTYIAPTLVGSVAAELSSIPRDEIVRRYSSERLAAAEVYPKDVWRDDPEALASVLADYDALVAFYVRAAARGDAVLVDIG